MSGDHDVCPRCFGDTCVCTNAAELARLREIERLVGKLLRAKRDYDAIAIEDQLWKLLNKD